MFHYDRLVKDMQAVSVLAVILPGQQFLSSSVAVKQVWFMFWTFSFWGVKDSDDCFHTGNIVCVLSSVKCLR